MATGDRVMPIVDRSASVTQIALDHPPCVRVFHARHIDFCCRGELTVQEACAGKGLDAQALFAELDAAVLEREEPSDDPRDMPTAQLVEHIIVRHHAYLRKALPLAEQLARKVARVHGEHNPKLPELATLVSELRETLEPHMDEEEESLFPALVTAQPDSRRIAPELRAMHEDHLRVGEVLTCIRTLADDYVAPDWACGSYRALMNELRSIELDTLRHVQIENHVLMPRFAAVGGPLSKAMAAEHERLEALLEQSVADPARLDLGAFEAFRAGLLRHIGIEEKILLPDARRRRGGEPLPVAKLLRVEHGALASLLVPTPDHALVGEIRTLLRAHDAWEEGPGGLYETCERLAGDEASELLERVRKAPPVPAAAHFDGVGAQRTVAGALRGASPRTATPGTNPRERQ
jgi:regulator of cell morphogenesis and NO signaling